MEDESLINVQEVEDCIHCVCEPQEYNLRRAQSECFKTRT